VTTETAFGVSMPVTAAGGGVTGALAPEPALPQPDIELNATALNSAHANAFFMPDLPVELVESLRAVFTSMGALQDIDK
jgi:hypothetical protein